MATDLTEASIATEIENLKPVRTAASFPFGKRGSIRYDFGHASIP